MRSFLVLTLDRVIRFNFSILILDFKTHMFKVFANVIISFLLCSIFVDVQEKAAFIFCVEDRALLCRDCDEGTHAPNTRSANHQRFLATGIRVALSSASCSKEAETNHFDPSNQQILSKPPTQQPAAPSPPWTGDEFFSYSDLECSNKVRNGFYQINGYSMCWFVFSLFF